MSVLWNVLTKLVHYCDYLDNGCNRKYGFSSEYICCLFILVTILTMGVTESMTLLTRGVTGSMM